MCRQTRIPAIFLRGAVFEYSAEGGGGGGGREKFSTEYLACEHSY